MARIIGPCDIGLIGRNGELFLIEFNMRFGGGYPVSHLAGAKFIDLLVQTECGQSPGLHTACLDEIFMMHSIQPFGGPIRLAGDTFRIKSENSTPSAQS